jgi:hypothetical protein
MTSPDAPLGHIDDGELVRYLDNELSVDVLAQVRKHLTLCSECQVKFDALRERAESFHRAMGSLDLPPAATPTVDDAGASVRSIPSSPTVSWRWRIAAMIAVVIGITLTVTPARAWLLETIDSIRTVFQPAGQTPVPPPEISVTGSSVRFAVTDSVLFVEFVTRPKSGTLTLQREPSEAQVSAAMLGGTGDDEIVVFGAGIRVVNTTESTADYVVTLPTATVLVEVRVGGAVVARHRPGTDAVVWNLGAGARQNSRP